MAELLAVTCDSCGEPMVPNVSTLDDDGCGWICLSPGCPELAAGELEAEDLVEPACQRAGDWARMSTTRRSPPSASSAPSCAASPAMPRTISPASTASCQDYSRRMICDRRRAGCYARVDCRRRLTFAAISLTGSVRDLIL